VPRSVNLLECCGFDAALDSAIATFKFNVPLPNYKTGKAASKPQHSKLAADFLKTFFKKDKVTRISL
ncbi:MAG: hypothetical protein ACREEM_38725, partial [Blastocatellia bacterium]